MKRLVLAWYMAGLGGWVAAQPTTPVFNGAPMSLQFQDIPVRTALQLIADFSGINIVVSDSVSGNLSLRLKDVPWDQALHTILQTKGLGQQQQGQVTWVASLAELAARDKLTLENRGAMQVIEPLQAHAFKLNFARAPDLLGPLLGSGSTSAGTALPRMLSARGSALADGRTNQLLVTDIPERIQQIGLLLERIDVPLRQVLIEARIVEADDDFASSLGVRLSLNSSTPNINLPASPLQGNEAPNLALSLFNASHSQRLGLALSALEAQGLGRVVASPRLVTADQAKAVIEQGTELPYTLAGANGVTSIAFRKANLRLEVTPHITPEGSITMHLEVHKDSVGQSTPAGFAIDTKHVSTQVRVDDGGTVMIGGIYETSQNDSRAGVPGWRDLPGWSWLFGNRTQRQRKQELLIFLSPKMLQPGAPAP
ncbi:MAG: type IV pilus secretin PilQ [Betaproteobacteria bacterium]|nr:type IV pilus secretin PilQ [Betaproteobacteria bacterium]